MGGLGPNPTFADLVNYIVELINLAVPLVFGLILVVMFWKLIDAWIINAGDQNKVAEGKQVATVGVLVLVVLSGIWGILALLRNSLFGL
jgi:hypothetical protein